MDIQTTISRDILSKFITVGDNIEKNIVPGDVNQLDKYNSLNRIHWEQWEILIEDFDDELLIKLYKGFVYVERELKWLGGSVAAAVWIAMFLAERKRNGSKFNIDNLRAWTLENTKNDYIISRLGHLHRGFQ
jgi:hypothetical protein